MPETPSNPPTFPSRAIPYSRCHGKRFILEHKSVLPSNNRGAEEEATLDPTYTGGWVLEVGFWKVAVAVVIARGVLGGRILWPLRWLNGIMRSFPTSGSRRMRRRLIAI